MLSDHRWRIAAAVLAMMAAATALAVVVTDDQGDNVASVAVPSSTTSSLLDGGDPGTSSSSSSSTTAATGPTVTASTAAPAPLTRGTRATASTAPATTPPASCPPPAPGSDFDGFGAAWIVIENSGGSHRSCVLTADTPPRHQQGLMRQDDLDGYDGMIFRYPTAEERSFWMRNTSIPLSIAFFDAGGAFVSATDMEPCGDSPECPHYPSRGPAKFALEVIRGALHTVGANPGSRLIG